jgi:hypothetical protein
LRKAAAVEEQQTWPHAAAAVCAEAASGWLGCGMRTHQQQQLQQAHLDAVGAQGQCGRAAAACSWAVMLQESAVTVMLCCMLHITCTAAAGTAECPVCLANCQGVWQSWGCAVVCLVHQRPHMHRFTTICSSVYPSTAVHQKHCC